VTVLLWGVATVLIVAGLVGTVLPALPGLAFIFAGVLLGAWIDDFQRIGGWTVAALGILAAIGIALDYAAGVLSAQRVGASRLGIVGAALGTVAGVFTGFVGLLFMPLVGAAVGEFLARRDALQAGKVGIVTWLGMMVGAVVKLVIAFAMVGYFIAALLIA
jgi:hypothetical protein